MRASALALAAVSLIAIRLFTGIYYRADSAGAYFVLKAVPDLTIERTRVDDARFARAWILDEDELDLVYGDVYRGAMGTVPVAALLLSGAALASLWHGARPSRPR